MTTTITSIERISTGKMGFQYRITVRCDYEGHQPWKVSGIVGAGDLVSYRRCQVALARHAGVMYVEPAYARRGGAEQWEEDVQYLLGDQVREVNAK